MHLRNLALGIVSFFALSVVLSSSVGASAMAKQPQAIARTVMYGMPAGRTGSNFVDGKVRPTGKLLWTGDGSAWFVIHA